MVIVTVIVIDIITDVMLWYVRDIMLWYVTDLRGGFYGWRLEEDNRH